jgi:hypothetical protein
MSSDPEFVRHTIPLIFDVPVERANKPFTQDALNGLTSRIIELIEQDERIQTLLRRSRIEWGIGDGTWEESRG